MYTNMFLALLGGVLLFSLGRHWKQYQKRKERENQFHKTTFDLLRWGFEDSSRHRAILKGLLCPDVNVIQDKDGSEKIQIIYENSEKPLATISLDLSWKNKEVFVVYDKSTFKRFPLDGNWKPRDLINILEFRPDPNQDPN